MSAADKPAEAKAAWNFFVGFNKLPVTLRRVVPIVEALTPALAIKPIAVPVSSKVKPAEDAVDAM